MMRRAKSDSQAAAPGIYLGQTNFVSHVRFDITSKRRCLENNDPCVSMCSCSVITSCVINDTSEVGPSSLNLRLSEDDIRNKKSFSLTAIETYCVERLMVSHGCYNVDGYDIQIGRDYYGETVTGVTLKAEAELGADVAALLALPTDHAKVMYVLNLEYGYIADSIKNTGHAQLITMNLRTVIPDSMRVIRRQQRYLYPLTDKSVIGVVADGVFLDGQSRLACRIGEMGPDYSGVFIQLRND
jgi:hypothetical protein